MLDYDSMIEFELNRIFQRECPEYALFKNIYLNMNGYISILFFKIRNKADIWDQIVDYVSRIVYKFLCECVYISHTKILRTIFLFFVFFIFGLECDEFGPTKIILSDSGRDHGNVSSELIQIWILGMVRLWPDSPRTLRLFRQNEV